MESIAVTYQHICEVRFSHQHLSGAIAGLPVADWLQFYPDAATQEKLRDKHLVIRPAAQGLRIAARIKADKEPLAALNGTRLRMGFSLLPVVAGHTKLPAHFLIAGREGRYAFGNSIARLNGSVFPSISKESQITADPTDQQRVFGFIEIDILKGADPYDLLDNTGKIKYSKGNPASKFQLLLEK